MVPAVMLCQPACTAEICFQPTEVFEMVCSSFRPASCSASSLNTIFSASITSAAAFFLRISAMESGWFSAARERNRIAGEITLVLSWCRLRHCIAVLTPWMLQMYSSRA
jgi:uncharacterized membrane protein